MLVLCVNKILQSLMKLESVIDDFWSLNPNWHEGGHFPPPGPFWMTFCQLNFYQKFPNLFEGAN